jgi:hypothetical protein
VEGNPSMNDPERMGKKLRVAGCLLIVGLLIEAACLLLAKPIGFVLFFVIGGLFLFSGVLVYLLAVVVDSLKTTTGPS